MLLGLLVIVHALLGFGLVAVVALTIGFAVPRALRNQPPPASFTRLQRSLSVALLVAAGVGVLLLAAGQRPSEGIHAVYGAIALAIMPLARRLAVRHPAEARYWQVGGMLVLLAVFLRLWMTA